MKYFLITLFSLLLISCISTQIISVENAEFTAFKNSATYKSCDESGNEKFGEYSLINNQWGKSKIKSGVYRQCTYYNQGVFGWEWEAPSRSYGVIGYPEIWMGKYAWSQKSNVSQANYYKSLHELKKLEVQYEAQLNTDDKKYNLSFDFWLHSEPIVAIETIAVEVMIWEDYQNFKSHGKLMETVQTSFGTYDIMMGRMKKPELGTNWNYIAFIRKDKRTSGTVDIKEILEILMRKNYISPDLYLSSIEFGTEILNSKGNILVKKYQVDSE